MQSYTIKKIPHIETWGCCEDIKDINDDDDNDDDDNNNNDKDDNNNNKDNNYNKGISLLGLDRGLEFSSTTMTMTLMKVIMIFLEIWGSL